MKSPSPIVRVLCRAAATRKHRLTDTASSSPPSQDSLILNAVNEAGATSTDVVEDQKTSTASTSTTSSYVSSKRRLQGFLSLLDRYKIVKRMVFTVETKGERNISTKTVAKFWQFFRRTRNANLLRASWYWSQREELLSAYKKNGSRNNGVYTVVATRDGICVRIAKTAKGRGRRATPWVKELYTELLEDFELYGKMGVKFNSRLFRHLALRVVRDTDSELVSPTATDTRSGHLITVHITTRWIEKFMTKHSSVCWMQVGKLSVSATKQEIIDLEVAYHLGRLYREFENGDLNEEDSYNADETHFKLDTNDGRTLAMKGDESVRFADIVSGEDGMTMMLLLGGCPAAEMGLTLLVFKNGKYSYPIRGVPHDVPGVCYRSQPKGLMDRRVFAEWLGEGRIFKPFPDERKRVIYVYNAGGHARNDEVRAALQKSNTELRLLPKNATEICQPADSFVIQKIKTAWRAMWDEKCMEMVTKDEWTCFKNGSGKLPNPAKRFFLQLAADSVRAVAKQRDSDGFLFSRKAMIRCGMALNLNGRWEVKQLFPHLQDIVKKYEETFNGTPVADSLALDGELTQFESDS